MEDFNKDAWLKQLAIEIGEQSELLHEYGDGLSDLVHCISIEELQKILVYYFPQIKLIEYDRTPTNTGDNSPELASNIAASFRQSQDEDATGTGTTRM